MQSRRQLTRFGAAEPVREVLLKHSKIALFVICNWRCDALLQHRKLSVRAARIWQSPRARCLHGADVVYDSRPTPLHDNNKVELTGGPRWAVCISGAGLVRIAARGGIYAPVI